jgi:hypothetical protein
VGCFIAPDRHGLRSNKIGAIYPKYARKNLLNFSKVTHNFSRGDAGEKPGGNEQAIF